MINGIYGLTLGEIIKWFAGVIVFMSAFVEITPIKINPISKMLGFVGNKLFAGVTNKIDAIDKKVDILESKMVELQNAQEESKAITSRVRILKFGEDLRHGSNKTDEDFKQVFTDIDFYEDYCKMHPDFENNMTVIVKNVIISKYEEYLSRNL